MFALAGAHRSGKTTTARAIADRMGIEFLETRVGDVFKSLGIDPKADLPFAKRLEVQDEILAMLEVQFSLRTSPFVADRSPFDVVGYTMADVRRDTLRGDLRDKMGKHVRNAFRIAMQNLRGIMVLCPLPDQVETPGKAQSCPYYMDHIHTLIREEVESATMLSEGGFLAAISETLVLEERVADGTEFFTDVRNIYMPESKVWMPNS